MRNHFRTKDYKYNAGHTKDYNCNVRLADHDAALSRSSCKWATGCVMNLSAFALWVFHEKREDMGERKM